MRGRVFYSLCLWLCSLQVLPLSQRWFIKSVVAVGKLAGVSLALQGAEQRMHEHGCRRTNRPRSGLCLGHGQKEGLSGTGFSGSAQLCKSPLALKSLKFRPVDFEAGLGVVKSLSLPG